MKKKLTAMEQRVYTMIVERALSAPEIAAELGNSPEAVKTHTSRIFRKYKVHSRAELTVSHYRRRSEKMFSGEQLRVIDTLSTVVEQLRQNAERCSRVIDTITAQLPSAASTPAPRAGPPPR